MSYVRNILILVAAGIIAFRLLMPAESSVDPESGDGLAPIGGLVERIQNDPFGTRAEQRTLVANSLKYVEQGADRAQIVNALATIATLNWTQSGADAVRAMAHISLEFEGMRRTDALLRVITADGTRSDARYMAARFLELEVDESIRTRLLEFVKTRWGTQEAHDTSTVLYNIGDTKYLQLLEEKIKEGNDWKNEQDSRVARRGYESEYRRRQMRLAQRPLAEILDAIASADMAPDRQYLVQQAARKGVEMKRYGAAVVKYLSLPKELTKRAWKGPLIEDCHRLGLFSAEAAKHFPEPVRGSISGPTDIVPWATGYEAKWLEVHHAKKSDVVDD